jgi:hypothetical protein
MLLNFFYFVSVLLAVGVMLRIFSQRSSRGSALAWLLLVILVPAGGALAYLLIGERRLGRTWMSGRLPCNRRSCAGRAPSRRRTWSRRTP